VAPCRLLNHCYARRVPRRDLAREGVPANRGSARRGCGEAAFGALAAAGTGPHDVVVDTIEQYRPATLPVQPVQPVLGLDLRPRMEFRVGPAQLLLSELLPLPVIALQARLDAELDANPALELPEPPTCPGCGHPVWRGRCARCVKSERREQPDPLATVRAATSPGEQLLRDAALEPADRWIAAHLVADLDEYGVLDEPVPAVAQRLRVSPDAVRRVIAALRQAGFPGLCAGSLVESLRLRAAGVGWVPPEVRALLAAGLDALAAGSPATAALASGLDPDGLRAALEWLRAHLTPEVFERADPAPVQPVDVVVRRSGGRLHTAVVPGPWSALRVAESYLVAADDLVVRAQVARAARFVDAIGRRERSLQLVSEVAVARQSARIVHGPRAHRPLTRLDVATELGLHESTVSRVVAGKHLALPSGETVQLATFFGPARDAQHCLRELIGDESVPLSDAGLAAALAQRGHVVARRTVAKYRAELGIPDRRRR